MIAHTCLLRNTPFTLFKISFFSETQWSFRANHISSPPQFFRNHKLRRLTVRHSDKSREIVYSKKYVVRVTIRAIVFFFSNFTTRHPFWVPKHCTINYRMARAYTWTEHVARGPYSNRIRHVRECHIDPSIVMFGEQLDPFVHDGRRRQRWQASGTTYKRRTNGTERRARARVSPPITEPHALFL